MDYSFPKIDVDNLLGPSVRQEDLQHAVNLVMEQVNMVRADVAAVNIATATALAASASLEEDALAWLREGERNVMASLRVVGDTSGTESQEQTSANLAVADAFSRIFRNAEAILANSSPQSLNDS